MSTELTTQNFPCLLPESDINEAMKANLTDTDQIGVQDLDRITVPTGGSTFWTWDDIYGSHSEESIDGILVLSQIRQTLWPSTYENSSGTDVPILVSFDGVSGRIVGEDYGDLDEQEFLSAKNSDGTINMAKLSYAQWGSGRNGGKRIRDERLLFVLRPGDLWPVMISVPPMSLKPISILMKKLTVPHFRAIVRLKLEKKTSSNSKEFSCIAPSILGVISKEEGEIVHQTYSMPLKSSLVDAG